MAVTNEAQLNAALNRIRRAHHTMGNDVPLWVEEQMILAIGLLHDLWRGFWQAGLLWLIGICIYDIHMLYHALPTTDNPIGDCLTFGVLGALAYMFIGAVRRA